MNTESSNPTWPRLQITVGMSQSRFHRLFSDWAAITSKEFLQCLTITHAKELLREGKSVLDTSLHSGLSGPGRLHDLCVKLEAASPGELKSGGNGLSITWWYCQKPVWTVSGC